MPEFAEWESFYVIVGAAAGALIGLQFVVLTLIADRPPVNVGEAGPTFATPTIIHFSVSLLLCAVLRVPWPGILPAAFLWGLIGVGGIAYSVVVYRRMRKQTGYHPDFEDWFFHTLLPFFAHGMLVISAFAAIPQAHIALFAVGGAALLLLFIGIHNAWDAIAYHVFVNLRKAKE